MKRISLGNQAYAIVNDEDFEELSKYKWRLSKCKNNHFYARRSSYKETGKKTHIPMHRQILNPPPGMVIDHINNNGLDNRRQNIRIVTVSQNISRAVKIQSKKTKYRGVRLFKARNKWYATIWHLNDRHFKGYYETQREAALAYNELAVFYHGEFASLNVVE